MPLAKKKRDNRHFMKRLTHDEVPFSPHCHPWHDVPHPTNALEG